MGKDLNPSENRPNQNCMKEDFQYSEANRDHTSTDLNWTRVHTQALVFSIENKKMNSVESKTRKHVQ